MSKSGFAWAPQAARDKAVADLREIRITEPPGKRRYARVYALVDSYTAEVIGSVESLKGGVPAEKEAVLADAAKKLRETRHAMMDRLRSTLVFESPREDARRPMLPPSLDPTPQHEQPMPPGGQPGILFR